MRKTLHQGAALPKGHHKAKAFIAALLVLTSCASETPPTDPEQLYLFERKAEVQKEVSEFYQGSYAVDAFTSRNWSEAHDGYARSVCGTYRNANTPGKIFHYSFNDWEGSYSSIEYGPMPEGWSVRCSNKVVDKSGAPVRIVFASEAE